MGHAARTDQGLPTVFEVKSALRWLVTWQVLRYGGEARRRAPHATAINASEEVGQEHVR